MIVIGIPIYNDITSISEEEYNLYDVVCNLIESIETHTKDEFLIVVRDNNSLDFKFQKFNVTLQNRFGHLNTMFISDKKPSLTDGWNRIVQIGLADPSCEAVVLMNQDIIVTKYWQNFIDAIKVQNNNLLSPLMTEAPYQPLQVSSEQKFKVNKVDEMIQLPIIQGCCFGGSRKAFEDNMFNDTLYFDPEYEFGYNEVEWQLRNTGKSLVLLNSLVIHLSEYSWAGIDNTNKKNPVHKDRDTVLGVVNFNQYLRGNYVG